MKKQRKEKDEFAQKRTFDNRKQVGEERKRFEKE